jgi:N-acetylglucosaminyl-diphospho-decaprenol L-rhamnosyltransferase
LLSIIIVNYNVKYFLEQCLYSVQKAVTGLQAEIIVIDNNSTDKSVEYLQPKFPAIVFVSNKNNIGYAKANNIGWKQASGQYILFLNPDTLIGEDSLRQSLAILEEEHNGAVGIRMIDGSGAFLPESKRGLPTPLVSFYKLSGLAAIFPHSKKFARYYLGHLPQHNNNEVNVLAGAYMMVKRNLLECLDGFDEQFFMYGEDIDLSYRISKAGYKNIYLADATIIHFKGESTRKDIKYVRLFYKAMSIFVKKHYRAQSWWMSMLLQLAIWCRAGISFLSNLFISRPSNANGNITINTLVVGTDAETASAINILNSNDGTKRNITTLAPGKDVIETCRQTAINEVVFCAGATSYKTIIMLLQQLPHSVVARFFSAGSSSIIGSFSKNKGGEVMVSSSTSIDNR